MRVTDVLDETGQDAPGNGACRRWLNVGRLDSAKSSRERRPVGNLAQSQLTRLVVARAARRRALVGRFELDGQLLDDLALALGRHCERGQLRTDVVTPVDRHYAGRILAT